MKPGLSRRKCGQLVHPSIQDIATRILSPLTPAGAGIKSLCNPLYRKPWVVYAKPPFDGPEKVLDYLGRYTHRVAIANHRLLDVDDGKVSFAFRDSADGDRRKVCTLGAEEFTRRFLLHVLPKGFVRIRHFGFLAGRAKGRDLPRCREALGMGPAPEAPPDPGFPRYR